MALRVLKAVDGFHEGGGLTVGAWDNGSDDTHRFGDFNDTDVGILLDDAHRFLPLGIPVGALDFGPDLTVFALFVAQLGVFGCKFGQFARIVGIRAGPGNAGAQVVDLLLSGEFDGRLGLAGSFDQTGYVFSCVHLI